MDLILFNDGLYYLYPVTPELVSGEIWKDCFDLCDILRAKKYQDAINKHEAAGTFVIGCMCR